MISVIVCSHRVENIEKHKAHILNSCGCDIEYIFIDNSAGKYSLASAYNKGVLEAKGEYSVFCHDDLFFVSQEWGRVLEHKFSHNPNIGMIGVAGTQFLKKESPFWPEAGVPFLQGKVIHQLPNHEELILSIYGEEEGDIDVAVVDGLFFAIPTRLFERISFDEVLFDGFHFYDLDIAMQVQKTHRVIVTNDIMVKHYSAGNFKEEWHFYAHHFVKKYESELPFSVLGSDPLIKERKNFQSLHLSDILSPKSCAYIKTLGEF